MNVILFSIVLYLLLEYFLQFLFLLNFYRNLPRLFFVFLASISLTSNIVFLYYHIIPAFFESFGFPIVASDGFLKVVYYFAASWIYPAALLMIPYLVCYGIVGLIFLINKKKKNKVSQQFLKIELKSEKNISRTQFLSNIFQKGLLSAPILFSVPILSGMFLGSKEILIISKTIPISRLHADLEGLKIVQISDIHVGTLIYEEYLDHVVQLLRDIRADVLVITGDIVNNNNAFLGVIQKFIFKLKNFYSMGIYAVIGNHDLIDDGEKLVKELTLAGVRFLNKESIILSRGKGFINLAGLSFPPLRFRKKRMQIAEKYLQKTQEVIQEEYPTILLNHHPSDFERIRHYPIDLTLSGHTHGGQIYIGYSRDMNLNPIKYLYPYYVDLYKEEKDRYLYVNRGLGHWLPLRINCPPEITVVELVSIKSNS